MISLGKMAMLLEIPRNEAMSLVDRLGINWLDVDEDELNKQLDVAQKIAKR
jgi:predicted HTH domain antitoxin